MKQGQQGPWKHRDGARVLLLRSECAEVGKEEVARRVGGSAQSLVSLGQDGRAGSITHFNHSLYPPSNPVPVSLCSNAHQAAIRDSFRPPKPFILPWAAMADRRSKKLKMMLERAPFSTLSGMNVRKESRAMFESAI